MWVRGFILLGEIFDSHKIFGIFFYFYFYFLESKTAMDRIAQANAKIENRIAEIENEEEYKALKTKKERDEYIREDEKLKELKANRDALVRTQPVQSAQPGKNLSTFPTSFPCFFRI